MAECKTLSAQEVIKNYEKQIERLKENTKSNKKAFDKLNSKYSHVCNERDALQKKLNGKYINVKANLYNVMAILHVSMLVGVGLTFGAVGAYGWFKLLAWLF